jgi:hypothetical protein
VTRADENSGTRRATRRGRERAAVRLMTFRTLVYFIGTAWFVIDAAQQG